MKECFRHPIFCLSIHLFHLLSLSPSLSFSRFSSSLFRDFGSWKRTRKWEEESLPLLRWLELTSSLPQLSPGSLEQGFSLSLSLSCPALRNESRWKRERERGKKLRKSAKGREKKQMEGKINLWGLSLTHFLNLSLSLSLPVSSIERWGREGRLYFRFKHSWHLSGMIHSWIESDSISRENQSIKYQKPGKVPNIN